MISKLRATVNSTRLLRLLAGGLGAALIAAAAWTLAAVRTVAPNTGIGEVGTLVIDPDGTQSAVGKKISGNQRVNLLFLAHGGTGGDDPDYTDTVLVLSIRPATHQAVAISLPRYLWVDIPAPARGSVQGKLYSAYALGASQDPSFLRSSWRSPTGQGDLAAATVGGVIGQPIDAWMNVDIKAFEALIDAMGGITLEIPTALDDPSFPSDQTGKTIHIHFDSGQQHLDGVLALEYARSRLSTSEADRARRQEAVMLAMFQRLKSAGLSFEMVLAAGALKDGLRTNLTPAGALAVRRLLRGVAPGDLDTIVLDDSPLVAERTVGDQEVVVPVSGTFVDLRAYVAEHLP